MKGSIDKRQPGLFKIISGFKEKYFKRRYLSDANNDEEKILSEDEIINELDKHSDYNIVERMELINKLTDKSVIIHYLEEIAVTFGGNGISLAIKLLKDNSIKLEMLNKFKYNGIYSYQLSEIIMQFDEDDRLKALDMCSDLLHGYDICGIILSFAQTNQLDLIEKYAKQLNSYLEQTLSNYTDEEKLNIIVNCCDKIETYYLVKLIKSFREDYMIIALDKAINYLDEYNIRSIILSISTKNRLNVAKKYLDKIDNYDLMNIINSLSHNQKISALIEFWDRFEIYSLKEMIYDLPEKDIIKILEKVSFNSYVFVDIIETLSDENKINLILKYNLKLSDYDILHLLEPMELETLNNETKIRILDNDLPIKGVVLVKIISSFNEQDRIKLIEKYINKLDSNNLVTIIKTLSEDNRIKLIEKYINKLDSDNLVNIILSLDIPHKKEALIKYLDKINGYSVVLMMSYFNEDDIIEMFDNPKLNLTNLQIIDIIHIISDKGKEKFISRNLLKLSSETITNIIVTMDEDNIIRMIEKYYSYINLGKAIKSLYEEDRIIALKKYVNVLSSLGIINILNSFEIQDQLDLLSELKDLFGEKKVEYMLRDIASRNNDIFYNYSIPDNLVNIVFSRSVFISMFDKYELLSDEQLKLFQSELLTIVKNSYIQKNYISDLKALIGRQASINFKKNKANNPSNFLYSGIAEELSRMISLNGLDALTLDNDFLEKKRLIIDAINMSYNEQDLANYLKDLNKIKIDTISHIKNSLETVINNLEGKENKSKNDFQKIEQYHNYLNQINNLSPRKILIAKLLNAFNIKPGFNVIGSYVSDIDLFLNYIYEIDNICKENNIDLEYIINSKNAYAFLRIFAAGTENVLNKSFEGHNRHEGGLLTQICTFALNNEQRSGEKDQKEKLEKLALQQLSLTQKGLDKIKVNRVKEIIYSNKQLKELLLNGKINNIFTHLYPNVPIGNNKMTLLDLYNYMVKDDRYSTNLTGKITNDEKKSLTFDSQNYTINEYLQKQRLLFSIIKLLNCDTTSMTGEELKKELDTKLSGIKKSIELINSSEIKGIYNLINNDLSLTKHQNISSLLLFLDDVMKYKKVEDKNHQEKKLSVENLGDYIDRVNLLSMLSSKYTIVLKENVAETIEDKDDIITYYYYYLDKMSKRVYRTIPNINGEVNNGSKKLNFRSYEVDDPEQLVAGVRINTHHSCFRLGGYQDSTIKYITSSPNGTIIAIEDNKGNFLGRVYGFRVGNAVHFTRIYYNVKFDFKESILAIGNEIIKNSKDIDYVTCIPYLGLRTKEKYIDGYDIDEPMDINMPQEPGQLYTDHLHGFGIALVASRYPVKDNKVEFSREEITEKFYKNRDKPREFQDTADLTKIYNIILRSKDTKLYNNVLTADRIIYGSDWAIIVKNNETLTVKIDYGDTAEATEYQSIMDAEINSELEKIKNNTNNVNDTVSISSL